jgi:hypothetical protein
MGFPYPYPLGLPKGSIRATITLLLSLNLVWLTITESDYAGSFSTTVAVALTFYFGGTMRGTQIIPRDTVAGLRAWGLPAGTIRTLLTLLFMGLTYYVFTYQGTVPNHLVELLNIMLGYLLGRSFNRIKHRFFIKDKNTEEGPHVSWIDHLKALVIVIYVSFVSYSVFTDFNIIPEDMIDMLIFISSIVMGFYFGERS